MSTSKEFDNQIKELEDKVIVLESKIDSLAQSIEDLVLAFNTAKGVTAFVKWLAATITAGGVIYAAFIHTGVTK